MEIIDTHCHLQFSKYDPDRDAVIKRALDAGVGMICVGTDMESSQEAIELASKYEGPPSPEGYGRARIWASVGIHPNDIEEAGSMKQVAWEELLRHPRVVAVGEVGLDYYRTLEPEKREKQRESFRQFLALATQYSKPLIIHCRSAHSDLIEILETSNWKLETMHGVIHSFNGTKEEAQQFIKLGFYVGLNGIITFSTQYEEMVRATPLDKILLETDAPFLAPVPHRGKRNEPAFVVEVARKIGEIKGITLEEVISQTSKNAKALIKLA